MSDNWQQVPPQQQSAQDRRPGQYVPALQSGQYVPAPQPGQYVPAPQPGQYVPAPQPGQYVPAPQPGQYVSATQPVQCVQQPVYLAESTPRNAVAYPAVYMQAKNPPMMNDSSDTTAFWLMIFGFFIPLLSLINICMHLKCSNPKARKYARISFCLLLLQIGAVAALCYYYYNFGNHYGYQYCGIRARNYYNYWTKTVQTTYYYSC